MEELIKQMIEEQKITNRYLSQLVGTSPRMTATEVAEGMRPVETKKGKKAGKVLAEFVPEAQPDGSKKLVEKEPEPTITIEQLRKMATRYSAAFSMEELLSLNQKIGGAKKLSAIDPGNYAILYSEMEERLKKENGKKATAGTPSPERTEKIMALTLDVVKEKAKAFMDKNGQGALVALLKAFGAGKLSELAADKYAAFVEAISEQG